MGYAKASDKKVKPRWEISLVKCYKCIREHSNLAHSVVLAKKVKVSGPIRVVCCRCRSLEGC